MYCNCISLQTQYFSQCNATITKIIIGEVVTEISPFISRHILAKLAECYFHTYSFFF